MKNEKRVSSLILFKVSCNISLSFILQNLLYFASYLQIIKFVKNLSLFQQIISAIFKLKSFLLVLHLSSRSVVKIIVNILCIAYLPFQISSFLFPLKNWFAVFTLLSYLRLLLYYLLDHKITSKRRYLVKIYEC